MKRPLTNRLAMLCAPAALTAALTLGCMPASAATWNLLLDGVLGGTFEADVGGGLVSNPQITWNGVLYDVPYSTEPPEYVADSVPPGAPYGYLAGPGGGGYGNFWNATAMGSCAALSCTIGFDFNGSYGEYFAGTGYMPTDTFSEPVGSGVYEVKPVPLPASLMLMLSGLGAAFWAGWRPRRV